MYLVCQGCNKQFMLAKIFGDGYYTQDDSTFQARLDEFLDIHHGCHENNHVNAENQFRLAYETVYYETVY